MSEPINPLENKVSYTTYFLLAAFDTTSKAEASELDLSMGPEGSLEQGGIIIVNDGIEEGKAPTRFMITDFSFDFTWSAMEIDDTASGGTITITDTSGGDFLTFLRKEVIQQLSTSLENMTFVLKIFWNYSENGNDENILETENLYFSIPEISHKIAGNAHFYECAVLPLYNEKADSTNYNRLYSMTITHKDGGLHDEIPVAKPKGGGIKPRAEEDSQKNNERRVRIEKSKPMKTLEDAFDALQNELNESVNPHQIQLQEWQKVIRTDHVNKLEKPIQEKDIPIKYNIVLGDDYKQYELDNRNLPFEQPDQSQIITGVRTIPTEYGEKIDNAIDRIMEYSRQVGIDASGINPKDYKVCKVWRREGDEVLYDIVIEPYFIPVNYADGPNTGKGQGGIKPFTYYFKLDSEGQPDDVMMFDGILHRSDLLQTMEKVQDEELARVSYGAEREEISAEREPSVDYFKTGYSGHRPKISNQKVLGVEYPKELADAIKVKYVTQNIQQSSIEITIPGNPELLSDLFRSPSDVVGRNIGKAAHYARPEVYPMYAKIIVRHGSTEEDDAFSPDIFYHQNWMHIYKIETTIGDGVFLQKLTLLRTDEAI